MLWDVGENNVTGHVRVEPRNKGRVWVAEIRRADGSRTRPTLGPAWVKDSGRRTPRGAVIWRAGQGSKPDATYLTPKEAEEALEQLLQAERDQTPVARRTRGKTWGDACDGFLEHRTGVRAIEDTTERNYESVLRRLHEEGLIPRSTPLRRVDDKFLERIQGRMLKRVNPDLPRPTTRKLKAGEKPPVTRLARKTISNRMLVVTGVLGWAKKQHWIGTNPTDAIDVVAAPPPAIDFNVLEPSQVELVARTVATVRDDELPRVRGAQGVLLEERRIDEHALRSMKRARAMWAEMIRVLAYTGQRFGEIRALRWRDVDFLGQVLRTVDNLPSSARAGSQVRLPKSKKGRGVPLIDPAIAALHRVSQLGFPTGPDDLVFPTLRGGMQDAGRVRDAFYDGLERAGLGSLRLRKKPIVLHDLRHTFGTISVRVFPLTDVQAWFGHADIKTTMRYVHYVPRRDAAAKLTAAFSADLGADGAAALVPAVAG